MGSGRPFRLSFDSVLEYDDVLSPELQRLLRSYGVHTSGGEGMRSGEN